MNEPILLKIADFFAERAANGETVFLLSEFVSFAKKAEIITEQSDFDGMLRAIQSAQMASTYQGILRNGEKITLQPDFFFTRINGFRLNHVAECGRDLEAEENLRKQLAEKQGKAAYAGSQKSKPKSFTEVLSESDKLTGAVAGVYNGEKRREYPGHRNQENKCGTKPAPAETRRPRSRSKNLPELVITKGAIGKGTKGNNVGTGNRCGHDKDKPMAFKPLNKSGKNLPAPCFNAIKKLTKAYADIKKYMPLLNSAGYYQKSHTGKKGRKVEMDKKHQRRLRKLKKCGSHVQMRSERRESIFIVLSVMLSTLDLKTMRVGVPQADGTFKGISMETIAERGGISLGRAERAMTDLTRIGYVKVFALHEKVAELYKGLPAVRTLSIRLFQALKLDKMLSASRKGISQPGLKLKQYMEDLNELLLQEQKEFRTGREYKDKGLPLYELRKLKTALKV